MRRSLLVIAGAALLAGLAASAPFQAFLAFANETCGPQNQYVFDGTVTPTTVTVGTDSIRDAKRKGVKDGLEQGLTAVGGDPSNHNSRRAIQDTTQTVFKGDYDGVTHVETIFNFAAARDGGNNSVTTLTVSWKVKVVILLPANADVQVTSHENGHLEIEKLLKDLANTRFGAVSGQILGQVMTDDQIRAILVPVKLKLDKIGNDATADYDAATNHGVDGGEDQIDDATNAFNAAAAANP